jgi:hypothetical protein
MADQLVLILDRRIREILESAYQRASHLAAAYKAETGLEHPLVAGGRVSKGRGASLGKADLRAPSAQRRRVRRFPAALMQEANAVVALIKSRGKHGATGQEIRKGHPKVGQSIAGFVEQHSDHRLRKTGKARSTRWFVKE